MPETRPVIPRPVAAVLASVEMDVWSGEYWTEDDYAGIRLLVDTAAHLGAVRALCDLLPPSPWPANMVGLTAFLERIGVTDPAFVAGCLLPDPEQGITLRGALCFRINYLASAGPMSDEE